MEAPPDFTGSSRSGAGASPAPEVAWRWNVGWRRNVGWRWSESASPAMRGSALPHHSRGSGNPGLPMARAALVLWIPAFAGHFFLAVVHPGTRPALRGMVLGTVDREWAAHHHAAWVAGLDRDARPSAHAAGPAPLPSPRRIDAVAADGRS